MPLQWLSGEKQILSPFAMIIIPKTQKSLNYTTMKVDKEMVSSTS